MPKFKAETTQKREQWVTDQFMANPLISGPEMNRMLKSTFKASMRTVRLYELRDAVLLTLGWTKNSDGRPVPPQNGNGKHYAEQANRLGEETPPLNLMLADPLIGRCVVPVEDVTDAVSFQQKIAFMNEKGFLAPKLNVEAVTGSYVILSRQR